MELNMSISGLAKELSQLLGYFRELEKCLEQETKDLSSINLESIAAINRQKEEIAAKVEARTEVLRRLLNDVSSALGLPADTSLGTLADKLRLRGNLEIPRLHKELNTVAEHNRVLLNLNREIAEKFSASVGNTLELLTKLINQSNTYGASGGYQQRQAGSVLINREA